MQSTMLSNVGFNFCCATIFSNWCPNHQSPFIQNNSMLALSKIFAVLKICIFCVGRTLLEKSRMVECAVLVITIVHRVLKSKEDILLGQAVLPLSAMRQGPSSQRGGLKRHTLQLLLPCSKADRFPPLLSVACLARRASRDVDASTQLTKLKTTLDMAAQGLDLSEPTV